MVDPRVIKLSILSDIYRIAKHDIQEHSKQENKQFLLLHSRNNSVY